MDNNYTTSAHSPDFWRELINPSKHDQMPVFFLTNTQLIGCTDVPNTGNTYNIERGSIVVLALISIITSISVALTIFYNPKLRIHPSKLIGYMCVCEAASCFSALIWVINPLNYICYFGIHYLWHWTTG